MMDEDWEKKECKYDKEGLDIKGRRRKEQNDDEKNKAMAGGFS